MAADSPTDGVDTVTDDASTFSQRGRTLLELAQHPDGIWTATQVDVNIEGTGETAALAAMEYCRRIAEQPPG